MKKHYLNHLHQKYPDNQSMLMRRGLLCFLFLFALGFSTSLQAQNSNTNSTSTTKFTSVDLWAEGQDFLDCNNTSVTFKTAVKVNNIYTEEGITYEWRKLDVNGEKIISTDKELVVTEPGGYSLRVTNTIDCTSSFYCSASKHFVVEGINFPNGFAGQDKKMYPGDATVTLQGNSRGDVTPMWVASNGGNIVSGENTLTPVVDAAGTYTLTLTHSSGCTMQDEAVVTREENTLTARIFSDPIRFTCDGPNYAYLRGFALLNDEYTSEGITYQWSGPNGYTSTNKDAGVTEPGEYTLVVTHTALNLTASTDFYVQPPMPATGSAGPDKVLTSQNTTVTLEGSGSDSYVVWFASDGGNIVSGERTYNPVVDAPGTYTMVVRNVLSECKFEDTVVVTREEENTFTAEIGFTNVPELDCAGSNSVTMIGFAYLNQEPIQEGITYQWSGPNGYTADSKTVTVTKPGDYTLVITETIGNLTASSSYTINPPVYPTGSAGPDKVLTSQNSTVTLEGSGDGAVIWLASDGGNIVSGERTFNPMVDAPGTYTLVLTNVKSGCKFEDTVIVTREEKENTLTARISTSGVPQLGCDPADSYYMMGVAMLDGQTVEEGIIFQWNGPNGYTSNDKNVSVSEAGDYTLTVTYTARNITATSEPLRVSRYTLPEGSAGPDKKLTCQNSTVTLEGSGHGMVQWIASHGGNIVSGSQTLNPVVDAPGIYTMTLNAMRGGCVSEFVVKVTREEALVVSAIGGQLDCTTGTIQLTGSSSADNASYTWTGPNGFTSMEQNPMVKVAGTYTLSVADKDSDCSGSTSVVVTPASTGVEITQHTIDFDNQPRGLISSIDTEAGPVAITGRKRNPDGTFAPENYAAIFDSQDPTGDDTNLYTTDWGQVLIINQYQNDYPDATQWGGELILDFSATGPVTMESFRVVGVDDFEDMSWVYLYDADGRELNKVYLKPLGMNSKQLVNLGNTRGVMKMKVVLDGRDGSGDFAGSAAIDNIKFHVEAATSSPCNMEITNITHAKAYPTAFSERSKIEFILRETDTYTINLYDAQGVLIKQLQTGIAREGELTTVEVHGQGLTEGMYFARLVSKKGSHTFKLVLKR